MNPHSSDDALQQRLRRLEEQNHHLLHQNELLHEAIETICAAFLNDSRNLDTAIQAAMNLTQRARRVRSDPAPRSEPGPGTRLNATRCRPRRCSFSLVLSEHRVINYSEGVLD